MRLRARRPIDRRVVRRDPAWLGVLGVVVIAIFVYAVFAKQVPFTHGYRVDAVLTSSNQLRKGSPVRVAGVDVGKVAAMRRGPGHTTEVTLDIPDGERLVRRDATLRVRPRLFLEGGFYVDLKPGSPSAPALGDGGTIPLGQTAVPVQFNDVLDTFDRSTRASLRGVVARFAAALGHGGAEGLRRAARPGALALRDAAVVADAARGTAPHDVSRLIAGFGRITAALSSDDAQLGRLIDGIARSSAAFAAEDRALARSIPATDRLLADTPAALRAVDRALPDAERLATALRPGLHAAPAALRRTAALLGEVRSLVRPERLPRLLARVAPVARILPSAERRLEALFARVTPVSDCLRTRAVPALKTKLDDGSLSTGRPVWLDLANGSVNLGSASASFDANGTFIRYLEGAGGDTLSVENVPGIGKVVAHGVPSKLRVRPQPLANQAKPPLRPDATCRDQAAPDLRTPDVPVHTFDDAQRVRARPVDRSPHALRRLVRTIKAFVARERRR